MVKSTGPMSRRYGVCENITIDVYKRQVPNLPEVLGGPDGYQLDAEVQARYAAWLAEHPYEMGTCLLYTSRCV